MSRLLLSSLLGMALLCGPAMAQKDATKKDTVAKDKGDKEDPKKEEQKGQKVKIKTVDAKTGLLVVTTAEGKTLTFKVNEKEVKILGPRGGMSDGFKDDRMEAGLELTLYFAVDGKTLKEIRFAVRKSDPDKDKSDKDKTVKDAKDKKDK